MSSYFSRAYFDLVYNQVYDLTTARLRAYHELQTLCINKLSLKENDRVLCVGLGTGNEIIQLFQNEPSLRITGVDVSSRALKKAHRKALSISKKIEVCLMDTHNLRFDSQSFDEVVCLHVMDFVVDRDQVISELLRVLRNGGQFLVTYPSEKESAALGIKLLKDQVKSLRTLGMNWAQISASLTLQFVAGTLCLPVLFRPSKKVSGSDELHGMFTAFGVKEFSIESFPLYYDLIVYGEK